MIFSAARQRLVRRGSFLTALSLCALAAMTVSGTASAKSWGGCPGQKFSQPFMPWGDSNTYTPLTAGTFESGSNGWTLTGGAQVTSGNEPFYVGGASDSHSLSLPSGSSATSPLMCVSIYYPNYRLFDVNTGSSSVTLNVTVLFTDPLGVPRSTSIGNITAGSSWAPTNSMALLANLNAILAPGGTTQIQLRFAPQGSNSGMRIDDIYIDPYRH